MQHRHLNHQGYTLASIDELEAALYGPSRTELTDTEVAMLEKAGVDLDERPDEADPLLGYATEFAAIRATSLTPAALAQVLGVTPVRVRQMIRDGSLFAIRIAGRFAYIFRLTSLPGRRSCRTSGG